MRAMRPHIRIYAYTHSKLPSRIAYSQLAPAGAMKELTRRKPDPSSSSQEGCPACSTVSWVSCYANAEKSLPRAQSLNCPSRSLCVSAVLVLNLGSIGMTLMRAREAEICDVDIPSTRLLILRHAKAVRDWLRIKRASISSSSLLVDTAGSGGGDVFVADEGPGDEAGGGTAVSTGDVAAAGARARGRGRGLGRDDIAVTNQKLIVGTFVFRGVLFSHVPRRLFLWRASSC